MALPASVALLSEIYGLMLQTLVLYLRCTQSSDAEEWSFLLAVFPQESPYLV
jgi:hypothetical protein